MLLKKQVRGGVLLYALFMAGIFTLLLQVYLERVVASSRQNQAQIVASQSRLMAEMTMDLVDKEAGAFSFSQGTTTYEVKEKQVIVRVASKGQILPSQPPAGNREPAYSSSSSFMPLGFWWAMPLWQSMQVSLSRCASSCCFLARCFCVSAFMPSKLWQLRHSRESASFMRFHSFCASSSRLASNFSGVSMVPITLP